MADIEDARATAVIADDEALARHRIVQLLRAHAEIRIVGECATGPTTLRAVRELSPDLLFLDVQMPGLTGFEVLAELAPEERPQVIFSTAYDEYALAAFEVHAVDYLLKPFADERFEEALARASRAVETERSAELQRRLRDLLAALGPQAAISDPPLEAEGGHLERFAVRKGDRVALLEAAAVDWVEAEGDYVSLHVGGKAHLIRATMRALEKRLDPGLFLRIHRSVIVRLDRVRHLQIGERGDYLVVLESGERLRVGPRYREALLRRVGMRW